MARSLASCGCLVLAVVLGLGGLGAGVAWFAVPGDGFLGKLGTVLDSLNPAELRVVEILDAEDGRREVVLEAIPLDGWDVSALDLSEFQLLDAADAVVTLQGRNPVLAGTEPERFVLAVEGGPESLVGLSLRMRLDVRATKHAGSSKVNLGHDVILDLVPLGATDGQGAEVTAAPEDPPGEAGDAEAR